MCWFLNILNRNLLIITYVSYEILRGVKSCDFQFLSNCPWNQLKMVFIFFCKTYGNLKFSKKDDIKYNLHHRIR